MAISDWPESERPREKLLKNGAANLSDAELLAIFLRTGMAGKSAVDLARELLTEFRRFDGAIFGGSIGILPKYAAWARQNMPNYRQCWKWRGAPWQRK